MTRSDPIPLSEFVVLGLLAERPRHGYEIEQQVEYRKLNEWTTLGHSLVYHVLRRTSKKGWVEMRPVPGRRGRTADECHLTDAGRAVLAAAVVHGLADSLRDPSRTHLALMFGWTIGPDDLREALRKRAERAHEERKKSQAAREGLERFQQAEPEHALLRAAIFGHDDQVLGAELEWSQDMLARLDVLAKVPQRPAGAVRSAGARSASPARARGRRR